MRLCPIKSQSKIHILVATAFIGDKPPSCQVNHKDGNKGNNCASNLEYVTQSENGKHAYRLGLLKHCFTRTLTPEQAREIKNQYASYKISMRELARNFLVSGHTIKRIIENKW